MMCRSCGAQIADKALVCYRCGKPTPVWGDARRRSSRKNGWRWVITVVIILLAVVYILFIRPAPAPLQ